MSTVPDASPDIHGMSIVLVGNFNPGIFHSAWFTKFELLPEEEAEDIADQVILPDFAQFSLAWLQLQVTSDRFQLSSSDPEAFNLLRDLAIGTFRILSHSPIRALGVNRDLHFRVENVERWHEIGLTVVPAKRWNGPLKNPGMRSLLVEGERDDGYEGFVQVRVEPSRRVFPGVYVGVNDHFQLASRPDEFVDASAAVGVLEEEWDAVLQRAVPLVDVVLKVKPGQAERTEAKRRAEEYERRAADQDSAAKPGGRRESPATGGPRPRRKKGK